MIYEIRHQMEYRYSVPVYLEPHLLHLMPRTDAAQTLKHYSLRIEPEPLLLNTITDGLGNPAQEVWFRGMTDRLLLESCSVVDVVRQNPFDYLLRDSSLRIPAGYPQVLLPFLQPYRHEKKTDERVLEFADKAVARSGSETVAFLSELCLQICRMIRNVSRADGNPWAPAKTLAQGKGACRDLAVLFMACCRSQGLAARFTSGYADGASSLSGHELHAWVEVYLEGAGWRGYDPTTGLAVCDQHVAIASSPDPQLVTPVMGTLRSNTASSILRTQVSIQAQHDLPSPAAYQSVA
ncbi:MAG: transglutaminase family protein [Candidatus Omnitrophica bacterium]|nr:transglutaminase family protein [Candidatus Omnitrophota bacterium]